MIRLNTFLKKAGLIERTLNASPFIVILGYILIASYRISYPGVQYDESLYLNAAQGGVDKVTFMTKTFHGIPVLMMPYIGALKAYIFYPIFSLFKVSPTTMRLPVILITGAALYILFRLLVAQTGRMIALLILTMVALDASFIMFTRLDNGPVVLDFLIKVIGVAAILKFIKDRKLVWLILFWASMLLGVFNKLNFIWYVNAFVAAFVIIYGKQTWINLNKRERNNTIVLSILGYLACIGYYFYIGHRYHLGSNFGFVGWNIFYGNLAGVVDGTWFYNYALSSARIGSILVFWVITTIIVLGLFASIRIKHAKKSKNNNLHFYSFAVFSLVLLLIQVSITRAATAGWHYFSVYPLLDIVVVLSFINLGRVISPSKNKQVLYILAFLVGVFCVYQLNLYRLYTDTYKNTPANLSWSPSIYKLITFAKEYPKSPFISLDWGTQTQLIGYDPVPGKFFELFGPVILNNPAQDNWYLQQFITSKPGAFYITNRYSAPLHVGQDFFKVSESFGYTKVLVDQIYDHSTLVYSIYQLKK
jgi:hypothetical protein